MNDDAMIRELVEKQALLDTLKDDNRNIKIGLELQKYQILHDDCQEEIDAYVKSYGDDMEEYLRIRLDRRSYYSGAIMALREMQRILNG